MSYARLCLLASLALTAPLLVHPTRALAGAQVDPLGVKKFEEGRVAYEKLDYATALAAFSASLELLPSPNTRLYIGRCQRELGRLASAKASLDLAAREAHDRLVTTGEKRFAATEEAAKSEAAALDARVPRLTIVLPKEQPTGLLVSIDGKNLPLSALSAPLELDPGKHTILVSAPGYTDFSFFSVLAEAEARSVEVDLKRIAAGRITLTFLNKPSGISVALDGKPLEPTLVDKPLNLPVGDHAITVQAPGYKDFLWKGKVADQTDTKIEIRIIVLPAPASTSTGRIGPAPWMTFAAAGVGAVALGVGTVFAIQAKNLSDSEQAKPVGERTKDERDHVSALSTRANVLFIGGGVFMVGAGILAATTQWSKSEKTVAFSPFVSPSLFGAALSGRF